MKNKSTMVLVVMVVGLFLLSTPAMAVDWSKLTKLDQELAPGRGTIYSQDLDFWDINDDVLLMTDETEPSHLATDGFLDDGSAFGTTPTSEPIEMTGVAKNDLNKDEVLHGRFMYRHTWDIMEGGQPDEVQNDLRTISTAFKEKTFFAVYWMPDRDAEVGEFGVLTGAGDPTFLVMTMTFVNNLDYTMHPSNEMYSKACGWQVYLEFYYVVDGSFVTFNRLDILCVGTDDHYQDNWFYAGTTEEKWLGFAWNITPPTGSESQTAVEIQYLQGKFLSFASNVMVPVTTVTKTLLIDANIIFPDEGNAVGFETTSEVIFDNVVLGDGDDDEPFDRAHDVYTSAYAEERVNEVLAELEASDKDEKEVVDEIGTFDTFLIVLSSAVMVTIGVLSVVSPTLLENKFVKWAMLAGAAVAIFVLVYVVL